jgi:hypothetical protein
MSDACETVVIQTENGPVVINKEDYDKAKHKLVGEEKPKRGRPAK